MKQEIFKVQRSLMTTEEYTMCMVYNEDRSIEGQFPITQEILDLMGDELKIYVKGRWRKSDGKMLIDGVVEWPGW